jgi:SAM-dependent methyltransferase
MTEGHFGADGPRGPADGDTRRLAHEALAAGEPTAWFERLYAEAADGAAEVPWDRGRATPLLADWLADRPGDGRSAIVVGCGYGRDSEHLARLGYTTTAFDIAPTAIADARRRHPESPVDYSVTDLLDLPADWRQAFELVVESNNVQALPPELHAAAAAAVTSLLAPGGTLLVLAARGDVRTPADGPPWPLTRPELDGFAVDGVVADSLEELVTDGVPRWRAVFRR